MPQFKPNTQQLNSIKAKIRIYQTKLKAEEALYGKSLELEEVKNLNQHMQKLSEINAFEILTPELQKEQNLLVEKSRVAMRKLMNKESISKLDKDFFNFIFQIQILLATYWPLNKPNEEGEYEDPLILTALEYGNDVVVSSTGYWFDKAALNEYFRRNNAFVVNNDVVSVRGPMDQEKLSEREVTHLKQNGIIIPRADLQLLAVNHALGLGGERIDAVDPDAQAEQQREVSRYNIPGGALRGWAWGKVVGGIIGGVGTLALIALAPPLYLLPLTSVALVFFTGGLSAVQWIANKPLFRLGAAFSFSILGNLLLMGATALLVPQILLGLTSLSIISIASAAAVTAKLPLIFAWTPIVSFSAGILSEIFIRDGLIKMFGNILLGPLMLCTATFGLIGKYTGWAISKMANLINPPMPIPAQNHQLAIENNPLLAENDEEFHPNQRGIMNGLGVNPQNLVNVEEPEAKQEVDTNIIQDPEEQDLSQAIEASLIRPSISRST